MLLAVTVIYALNEEEHFVDYCHSGLDYNRLAVGIAHCHRLAVGYCYSPGYPATAYLERYPYSGYPAIVGLEHCPAGVELVGNPALAHDAGKDPGHIVRPVAGVLSVYCHYIVALYIPVAVVVVEDLDTAVVYHDVAEEDLDTAAVYHVVAVAVVGDLDTAVVYHDVAEEDLDTAVVYHDVAAEDLDTAVVYHLVAGVAVGDLDTAAVYHVVAVVVVEDLDTAVVYHDVAQEDLDTAVVYHDVAAEDLDTAVVYHVVADVAVGYLDNAVVYNLVAGVAVGDLDTAVVNHVVVAVVVVEDLETAAVYHDVAEEDLDTAAVNHVVVEYPAVVEDPGTVFHVAGIVADPVADHYHIHSEQEQDNVLQVAPHIHLEQVVLHTPLGLLPVSGNLAYVEVVDLELHHIWWFHFWK